jgi:hypothetical protein
MAQAKLKTNVVELDVHAAKLAGREAADIKAQGDKAATAQLLSTAKSMTEHMLEYYITGLREQFDKHGYASSGSMASRYKGAMLYAMKYSATYDLSNFTVTELYSMAKESSATANKKGSGPKKQTKAQQIDKELAKLVKKFGKAAVAREAAKLLK